MAVGEIAVLIGISTACAIVVAGFSECEDGQTYKRIYNPGLASCIRRSHISACKQSAISRGEKDLSHNALTSYESYTLKRLLL